MVLQWKVKSQNLVGPKNVTRDNADVYRTYIVFQSLAKREQFKRSNSAKSTNETDFVVQETFTTILT